MQMDRQMERWRLAAQDYMLAARTDHYKQQTKQVVAQPTGDSDTF